MKKLDSSSQNTCVQQSNILFLPLLSLLMSLVLHINLYLLLHYTSICPLLTEW
uniref:Uncharacterized protein n=1 Tax=Nelumbo nucifera TaxID=4432 RepID=A0A822Z9Y7_NELNU|nr:TPA_asm: hypothetical protein HUJ06_016215 [Nelumbo nucifera]